MALRRLLLILAVAAFCAFEGFCHETFVINVDHKFAGRGRNLSAFKAHDAGRHRSLLSSIDIPLGGNGSPSSFGLYYAKIGLGNPSKDYYVQVDTGSDLLWVNCIGCTNCPQKSNFGIKLTLYDPASSRSSSAVYCNDNFCKSAYNGGLSLCDDDAVCQYSVAYGDGSASSGYFVKDEALLRKVSGNFQTSAINGTVIFGCGAQQSGELATSSEALDGIIGFGQASSSLLSQLASAGKIKKVFSHCLDTKNGGGIFVIGESASPTVNTTPLASKQSHYNVEMKGIEVDGSPLDLPPDTFATGNGKGTIIDSGTTLAYFPGFVYQQLMAKCLAKRPRASFYVVNDQFQCFKYSGNVDDGFPEVTFQFQGSLSLTARPRDYLFQIEANEYCFGWQSGGASSDEITILGDLVLSNKLVVYDLERQSIGWTEYDCSSSIRVKDDASSSTYSVGSDNVSPATRPGFGLPAIFLLMLGVVLCLL